MIHTIVHQCISASFAIFILRMAERLCVILYIFIYIIYINLYIYYNIYIN